YLSFYNQCGSAPDVIMATFDRVGSLVSEGQLSELTLADYSKADDTTTALLTNGGKVYGSHAVIETLVIYYNKDLLTDAPKT
ncbi:extracellular solute-binding protein, partial [Streptococcus suis]